MMHLSSVLTPLYIDWQPEKEIFQIGPFPILWYSTLWIIGLAFAVVIVGRLYKEQKIEDSKFEPLFFYCFFGILIGARLGHCLFYEPNYYLSSGTHFLEMIIPFKYEFVPEAGTEKWAYCGYQGLASHGGTIGLFIALLMYVRKYKVNVLRVLDNIAIATPITACFIRLGNLMNSEIVGKPTDVPWAFIFHSHDGLVNGELGPRHPAQLYEAIAYLIIFFIGFIIYKRCQNKVGTAFYFGYCLFSIFTFRFFVEFIKKEQVDFEQNMLLDMGQILSIPFIFIGIYCMIGSKWLKRIGEQKSAKK